MQTRFKQLVARLRNEGSAVVLSIPLRVREELALKGGDMVMVRCWKGNLVARKVDLSKVAVRMPSEDAEEVNGAWLRKS